MAAVGEVKDAVINPSTATDTPVVAAPGEGLYIKVLSILAIAAGANNLTFKSANTAKSPVLALGANGGFVAPFQQEGWFDCNQNEALNLTTSAAQATGVLVKYRVCKA